MGRVILCTGKRSKIPFEVRGTGMCAETIEELCYIIRNNIDMLDISAFDRDMSVFIRDGLGLAERGKILEQLIISRSRLKDRFLTVLSSCDLYDDKEIRKAEKELDEISVLSAAERRKRRADRYMNLGNYIDAAMEYRSILSSVDSSDLSDEAYGDILHNLGVFEIRSGETDEAARLFLEAYERNQRELSLKQYLSVLKLSKNSSRYRSEVQRLVGNVNLFNEIEDEINEVEEKFERSPEYEEISRLKVLWQQGRFSEAKRLSREIITGLKQMYREDT